MLQRASKLLLARDRLEARQQETERPNLGSAMMKNIAGARLAASYLTIFGVFSDGGVIENASQVFQPDDRF